MKTKLEFKNIKQHDDYIRDYVAAHQSKFQSLAKKMMNRKKIDLTVSIVSYRKSKSREPWTQHELQFILDFWRTKEPKWIAAALKRSLPSLHSMVAIMRNSGAYLPPKVRKNGKIIEYNESPKKEPHDSSRCTTCTHVIRGSDPFKQRCTCPERSTDGVCYCKDVFTNQDSTTHEPSLS